MENTAAEALRFAAGPDTFKTQQRGVADSLPHPLHRLTNQRLSCIDYIVRYKAGGMRIGLTVGTNARDATALLESLETIVADSPNDHRPTAGP